LPVREEPQKSQASYLNRKGWTQCIHTMAFAKSLKLVQPRGAYRSLSLVG
jgi:hypothetical protein